MEGRTTDKIISAPPAAPGFWSNVWDYLKSGGPIRAATNIPIAVTPTAVPPGVVGTAAAGGVLYYIVQYGSVVVAF